MNGYLYAYLFTFLLNLIVGVSILARNPRWQANRVFFLMTFIVGLLAFAQFEFVKAESLESARFWYRAGLPWPVVLPLLLHFTAIYARPPQERITVPVAIAFYLPAAALVISLLVTPASSLSEPIRQGAHWAVKPPDSPSLVSWLSIGMSTLYTLAIAAWNILHLLRAQNQTERRQRLVVLIGVLIGLVASVVSYAVLPAVGVRTPDLATYGFGIGCVILGIAILKYRMFTLDVVAAAEEIVRDMPSALILLGPDDTVVRVNEAAHALLGVTADTFTGQSFLDRVPDRTRITVQDALRKSSRNPGISVDAGIVGAGKEEIPVSLTFSPVTDEKGRQVGTVCLGRDLRREVQTEIEKRELEERLRQSEKMEAIGRLAGGVAHDFNNILAGILGYADLIRSQLEEGDSKLSGYVENIVASSKRAARLVANLLTFARKKQLNLEPVDMHKVAIEVAELLEHSIDKRIEVMLSLDAGSPLVLADAAQIQNAVLNLAINARDAIAAAGAIRISTSQRELDPDEIAAGSLGIEPGSYVLLSVQDTGRGISSDSLDRIFDPFFTTKEVGRGTGLGLASVYGTAHACRGTVTAESREGQGSTFTVYLPAVPAHLDAPAMEDNLPADGEAFILVIDDEKFVRDVITVTLETLGYQVHCSADGAAGVEFLQNNAGVVDLVILDLNMPGQSGYEVFRNLKKIAPDLPVVISTGLLSVGEGAAMLNERAAGFLQKPFGRAQLASTIEEVLTQAGRPGEDD